MAQSLMERFVKNSGRYELAASIESAAFALSLLCAECGRSHLDGHLHRHGRQRTAGAPKIKAALPGIKINHCDLAAECDFIERARMGGVDSFLVQVAPVGGNAGRHGPDNGRSAPLSHTTPEVMVGELSSREFTVRELEVLRELLTGDSNAENRGTPRHERKKTHRNYISQMMSKTGLIRARSWRWPPIAAVIVNKDF